MDMLERIANALLHRVYYPMTAAVCRGRRNRVIRVMLFDTGFMAKERLIPPGTRRIDLIISHPDGSLFLTQEEIVNCRRIASQAADAKLRIYVYGEDIGLKRVDSSAFSGYNGENAC